MSDLHEFLERFSKYSDSQLYDVYENIEGYTLEAKNAVNTEIEKRGGLNELNKRINLQFEKQEEIERIQIEVKNLFQNKTSKFEIEQKINSNILSKEEISNIIEEKYSGLKFEENDEKVKPKTLVGGIFGAIIGSILGGVLWGVQLIFSAHVFYIFAIGLTLLNYGIIYLFTKQSYKNVAVLILTAISVVVAIYFGFHLYSIFGYRGYNHY